MTHSFPTRRSSDLCVNLATPLNLRARNEEHLMSDLEAFRADVRAWLEANCPPEMREPVRDEDDVCWGGRTFVFKNEAQKLWLERCVEKGYRSEEHTSELQSLMRISYAVFCL